MRASKRSSYASSKMLLSQRHLEGIQVIGATVVDSEQTRFDDLLLNGFAACADLFNRSRSCGCRKRPCSRSCFYRHYDGQCRLSGVRFSCRTWTFDDPISHRATVSSRRRRSRDIWIKGSCGNVGMSGCPHLLRSSNLLDVCI
jgi:hypothetical protein